MAYEVEIDGLVLPIPPSKIDTKIKGNNKTINLINDGDINVLKFPGLTEFSFDARLSWNKYPFSLNDLKPNVFLDKFEELMASKKPCQLIIKRPTFKGDTISFKTDRKVSLEDYTIKEDAKDGMDIVVNLKFKLFRDYKTKIVKIIEEDEETTIAVVENQRNADSVPQLKTYTVVKGDCLWNIAKKYLGDGRRYTEIYELNKDIITNPNRIYLGQVLKMPDDTLATPLKTTTKKKETPSEQKNKDSAVQNVETTLLAKPKTVKVTVKMGGKLGFTEACYFGYTKDKVKTVGTFRSTFSMNVDTDSTVEITFRHTIGNKPINNLSLPIITPNILGIVKTATSIKVAGTAKNNITVSVIWK
jgi:LysM repeat protein